jgi:hypothetical protein
MAHYEHLPIYKKALETAVYIDATVRNFSRYNKYGVGSELRELSRRILQLVIRANNQRDKRAVLAALVEACELLKTLIVFAKEVKAFNGFESFRHAAGLVVVLCKQSQGWLQSSLKGLNHQPSSAAVRIRADERAHEHCAPSPPLR